MDFLTLLRQIIPPIFSPCNAFIRLHLADLQFFTREMLIFSLFPGSSRGTRRSPNPGIDFRDEPHMYGTKNA
ncbi:MAG: hypothetical protein DRH37_00520 [Deltaproteobacteria bacterium]|nr:MAG: hypothetical protein DRH37_00520 [Deltaproteobacteria bacterium]